MDFNAYFLHCPYDFNRYLTRKIDNKSYLNILIILHCIAKLMCGALAHIHLYYIQPVLDL